MSCAGAPAKPEVEPSASGALADVVEVAVSGQDATTFSVSIRSPDTGCSQYADWWEVLDEDGALVTRRVLGHSHVDEQPFTRSGSPVDIDPTATFWVRAHMNPGGYGGQAMVGSPADGFVAGELSADWAADVGTQAPLPDGCAF